MPSARFEEVLGKLDAALDFCRSLGLGGLVERGRFAEHRRRIQELIPLITHVDESGLSKAGVERLRGGQVHFATALIEALEFAEALEHLRGVNPEALKRKLEVVLTGPPLPINEDASSTNAARNTLFELYLASRIVAGGLPVELGEHPDLTCRMGEVEILIECKRPFSPSGVSRAAKQALDQLHQEIPSRPAGAFGLIAVSTAKVLNPGDSFLSYYDEHRASEGLSRMLLEISEQEPTKRVLLQAAKDGRIVGALFHVSTVALDRTAERFTLAIQLNVHPIALGQEALKHLGEAIARGAKYVGVTKSGR